MTEDPDPRTSWPRTPPMPSGHPTAPGPAGFGAGGPETRVYPGPPGAGPPPGGFSWREQGDMPEPARGLPIGRILVIVGAIAALLAAAAAAYFFLLRPTQRPPAPPVTAPAAASATPVPAPTATAQPAPSPLTLTAATACISPPSHDAAGTVVEYGPDKMVDGRADTAWRCDGDGVGRTVRVNFNHPASVQQIGIIPGYAKTDPTDGTDRYAQNRRIAQIRYTFDDGRTIDQTLDTAITNRSMQFIAVPGISSSSVTVSIVRSVPGNALGPNEASDRVAISELKVTAGA